VTSVRSNVATERVEAVKAKSASFRKELGLADLALTQILYVVGTAWVGTAAKLGPSHLAYWLLAIASFYLPQAAVVVFLSRQMPIEGGPYQWAAVGLGEFMGFLVAWNIWAYTILVTATISVIVAVNVSYLVGPQLVEAGWYTPVVSASVIVVITLISVFGLGVGKWLQDLGGIAHVLTFLALVTVPFLALYRGALVDYHPLAAAVPEVTPMSLNIFSKLALGAFSGFEYVAILAGECRDPGRTIGRSVIVAVPIIAAMFILGTSSVLALVPQDRIDLVSPIPQTLTIGFQGAAFARFVVPALIVLLLLRQLGALTVLFAGNTRLPMVAGWDGLLPAWFGRLHPRFRTPLNSILFVGALALALVLAGQAGVGVQEAFQLLDNAAGVLYSFMYVALFAIPLVASKRLLAPAPAWLRAASAAGMLVTLLYIGLSIVPIVDVVSWRLFALKIIGVIVATNLVGAIIYFAGQARSTASEPEPPRSHTA
jgi:amino acid transporter